MEIFFAASVGLIFGSFANVVIHRVPRGGSIVRPGSFCPACNTELRWFENIPLFSYLALGRRCRTCDNRISPRYPLVEVTVALIWVGITARVGLVSVLPAMLAMGTVAVILSAVDLERRLIPNRILGPASLLALGLLAVAAVVSGDFRALGFAGVGAISYALPLAVIAIVLPAGMGFGDVKLVGYLGAHLGWFSLGNVLVGAMTAFLGGGFVAIVLLVTGRRERRDAIPFGPFLCFGALLSLLWGDQILQVWLGV